MKMAGELIAGKPDKAAWRTATGTDSDTVLLYVTGLGAPDSTAADARPA